MWNFKKCPKCQGDIFIDQDIDASYEKCLQCGYEREMVKASRGIRRKIKK
jgi:DNA-directed RNA polymerase subunit M/transcription elongation factor TFIIS